MRRPSRTPRGLAALLFGQDAVAAEWRHQADGKRRVDFSEELEEDQADGIDLADQPIATRARDLFDPDAATGLATFRALLDAGQQRIIVG
jgi:hypothetical protein